MVFWSPLWPRWWARRLAAVGGMTLLGVFSDDAEDVGVLINFLLMV